MKKRSLTVFLLLYTVILQPILAQETKIEKGEEGQGKAISITFNPLYAFNKAIKIDAELQTKKPLAFIAGAEFYSGRINVNSLYQQTNNFGESVDDKISGLGINLAIKYKFQETGGVSSYYFSPGLTYRLLDLKLIGPAYYSYTENGLTYYSYGLTEQSQKIKPLLVYGNFGRYIEINSVVLDAYFGIGYKILNQNKEVLDVRKYHTAMFGYNYEGPIFQIGFKLGWQITK